MVGITGTEAPDASRIAPDLSPLISKLVEIVPSGKIPIIIGGGHNNAYGNIKGLALAKGKPVNAINFDAHSDFRIMEGRHSGNGFSYAFEEGGCFLVLDLLSCTLESRLDSWRDQRCFPFHNMTSSKDMISRIEKVGLGIARGMEYLHSLNIIFRDLKPHNIGFDENDIVKIFDFGLAREFHHNFPSENRRNEGTRQMTGNCGTPR